MYFVILYYYSCIYPFIFTLLYIRLKLLCHSWSFEMNEPGNVQHYTTWYDDRIGVECYRFPSNEGKLWYSAKILD